ncbi:WD40/YVTN/BNR-like repeat-containing protein [Gorillibacterium timonense]|uniref:WD40/YVTN/BNR-like repeat-containing protein n=1 Tax=Gorillibacterium timonense TaxID=1689269 RepID=UPI00071E4855|nr:hypothetical protein [Gorillibacterium timonense]
MKRRLGRTAGFLIVTLAIGLSGCSPKSNLSGKPLASLTAFYPGGKGAIWAADEEGRLLRSTDKGKHFFKVMPKGLVSVSVSSLFALNAKQAWIVDQAGKVYRTMNGGRNWKKSNEFLIAPNRDDMNLVFSDVLHGWLRNGSSLYRSEDGGMTWTLINPDLPAGYALNFTSPMIGWQSRFDGIYKTEDGGRQWKSVKKTRADSLVEQALFFDEKNGMLLRFAPDMNQQLAFTSDGGITWTPLSSVPTARMEGCHSTLSFSVAADDHLIAYYQESGRLIEAYYTHDQGRSWRTLPLSSNKEWGTPIVLKDGPLLLLDRKEEGVEVKSFALSRNNGEWETYRPIVVD